MSTSPDGHGRPGSTPESLSKDPPKTPRGWQRWLLPSPSDLVFLTAFFAAVALGAALTSRDGDLGRHLRIAEWMFDNRALPLEDVFSFTRTGSPVVVHEWLAQLALGAAHRVAGFNGIGLLTAALVAAPWAMINRALLKRAIPVSTATTLSLLGAVASVVHWAARPHVFTFVFFAYWVIALADFEQGSRRTLYALPLLTVLWANTHGAFIVGFVLVGMYLTAALFDRRFTRARHLLLVLLASVAASLVNPNGFKLIANSFGYIGDDFLLRFTTEYNSPDFHLKGFWPFLAILLAGVLVSLPRRNSARILFVGWAAFALYSFRNVPLFALAAIPLLAEQFHLRLQAHPGYFRGPRAWLAAGGDPWTEINRNVVGGALSLVVVIVLGLTMGPAERDSRFFFRPDLFPVATMDVFGADPPGSRLFNQFAWGGYLLYCCWPEIEVFIDGQTDFYGPDLTREYDLTISGRPDWNEVLSIYQIDWVLIEPDTALAQILAQSDIWREASRDDAAIIFTRDPGT